MLPESMSAPEVPPEKAWSTTVMLIRKARGGDKAAFEELFERHYGRVRGAVALRIGKPVAACGPELDDAVQDAILYAWQAIDEGKFDETRSDGGFRSWIAKIAGNKLIDLKRKKQAKRRGEGREKFLYDMFDDSVSEIDVRYCGPTPSEHARVEERTVQFDEALVELDDRHRQIIVLRDYCDMSFDEIVGEMDGLNSAGSARSLHFRALAALGDVLERRRID